MSREAGIHAMADGEIVYSVQDINRGAQRRLEQFREKMKRDSLVKWLRETSGPGSADCNEAADMIEKLTADLSATRRAKAEMSRHLAKAYVENMMLRDTGDASHILDFGGSGGGIALVKYVPAAKNEDATNGD